MAEAKITGEGNYTFPDGSVMTYTITNGYHMDVSGALGDGEIHLDNEDEITVLEIKEGVTSIGAFNFSGWSRLKMVHLHKGIKSVGHRAFYGCKNLDWQWLWTGLESIDSEAFKGCSSLLFVYFPETLQSIGDKAFESCDKLKLAIMPRGHYIKIGEDALGAGVKKMDRPHKNARGARIVIDEIKPNEYHDYRGCTVDIHVTVYSCIYNYKFSFWLLDHDTGWDGDSIMDGIYESEVEWNDDFDEDMELSDIYTDEELEKMAWDEIMDSYEFCFEDCPFLDCINDVETLLRKKHETQFEEDSDISDPDIDYLLEDNFDFFWDDLEEEDLIDFDAMNEDGKDYRDYVEDFEKEVVFDLNPPVQEAKTVSLPDSAIEYCKANPADCLLLPYAICEGISGTHFVQPRGILRKVNRILKETDWTDKDAAEAALLSIRKHLLKKLKMSRWVDVDCWHFSRYENYQHEVNEADEELETLIDFLSKICPNHEHSIERKFDFGPDRSGDMLRLRNECNAVIPEKIAYDFLIDKKMRADYSAQVLHQESTYHSSGYDKTRLEFIKEEMLPIFDGYLEENGNYRFFDAGIVLKEYEGETFVKEILEAESEDDYYHEDNGLILSHGIFYNCQDEGTQIEVEVTSEEDYPYRGEVHIPSSISYNGKQCTVSYIGSNSFVDCTEVKKVVIENGLTEISDEAFLRCSQLSEVTLPYSLRIIGNCAFEKCTSLKRIFIPKNVESIDTSCFEGCSNLEEIIVDESNTTYKSVEGVLYDRRSGERIYVPDANKAIDDEEEISHGEIIEEGDDVFSVDGIRYELSEEQVWIGNERKQKKILRILPLNDEAKYSGSVEIPARIKYHKRWREVMEIDKEAFKDCPELTEIHIPSTVSSFPSIKGCPNLARINVEEGNLTYCSMDGVLYSAKSNYGVQQEGHTLLYCYPPAHGGEEFVFPEFVDSLVSGVFEGCLGLKSVVISDKVTMIPSEAFKDCLNLENVIWGAGLESICSGAFENCISLKSIVFTESINKVHEDAFEGCSNIKSITFSKGKYFDLNTIPKELFPWNKPSFIQNGIRYTPRYNYDRKGEALLSVIDVQNDTGISINADVRNLSIPERIEQYGFVYEVSECRSSFKQFPSLERLELPSTVKEIGIGCIKTLREVVVDKENPDYCTEDGVLCNKQRTILLSMPRGRDCKKYNVPEGIVSIAEYAFRGHPYIEEVIIPDSTVKIEKGAFEECSSLHEVHLGNGLQRIGAGSFAYTAIERIVLPQSFRFARQEACDGQTPFFGSKLKEYALDGEHELYTVIDGVLYIKNSSGLRLRYCPPAYEGHLQLPEEVNDIDNLACYCCSELTSVYIPDGVDIIGNDAFRGCEKLEKVEFDGHVRKIGRFCFSGCSSLKELDCIGVSEIEDTAFNGLKGLKLNLPYSLEKKRSNFEQYIGK